MKIVKTGFIEYASNHLTWPTDITVENMHLYAIDLALYHAHCMLCAFYCSCTQLT